MSGKILHSRTREIIMMVDDYFEKEKEENKLLLQNVTKSLKNTSGTSEDVVISKETVLNILNHLQNTTKVTQRVMNATGIAKKTVAKLRREKQTAIATGTKISTPERKRKRGRKEFLDEFALSELRNIIYSIYTVQQEIPTVPKILAAAKQNLNYKGSETTLRNIIKESLGIDLNNFTKESQTLNDGVIDETTDSEAISESDLEYMSGMLLVVE